MANMTHWSIRFFGGPADGRQFDLDTEEPNELVHMEMLREEGKYLWFTAFVYLRTRLGLVEGSHQADYHLHDVQVTRRHEQERAGDLQ